MAPKSKTATSTPRLSEYARSFVYPSGIVKTVWPRVEAKGREVGLGFDWWQSQLGTVCLGYRKDGKYAATVGGVGISIPRQVGKTYFVLAMIVCLCLIFPGLQVVWTAHHLRTSTKTFTALQGICRRKKIRPLLKPSRNDGIRAANGEQEVEFANGSKIMFGARSRGFGRGFDEIDIEVFDEAQILDTSALENMIAATNQARHVHGGLLFFMGTPPKPADPSEAFKLRRAEALSGHAEDVVWLEIGADPKSDPDDPVQYPLMNPSFPKRTPIESLLRLRKNLGDEESWNREGRGIWDQVNSNGVIPADAWTDRGDAESVATDQLALGIEVGPDLAWASVGLAGQRADGQWHVELDDRRDGAAWVVAYVQALVEANPGIRAVVADVGGPVATLLEQRSGAWYFKGTRVRVTAPTVKQLGSACTMILNLVVTGGLVHIRQPQLDTAVQVAGKRALGDTGMWVFSRKTATSDITPVQSVTLALLGAQMSKPIKPGRSAGRSSGRREAVLL